MIRRRVQAGPLLAGVLATLLSCGRSAPPDSEGAGGQRSARLHKEIAGSVTALAPHDPSIETARSETKNEPVALAQLMQQVLNEQSLPGAPEMERHRAAVLARSKGEPVIFERTPVHEPGEGAAKHYSYQLLRTSFPWDVLQRLLPTLVRDPTIGKALLLREGYFYAETPDLAFSLVSQVGIQHLFREDRVWIHRGENVFYARRKQGRYYYEDGPYSGEPAKLLLFDRVGTGEVPRPLHVDVRSLRYRTFFDEVRVRHITTSHVVADLRYEDVWVPSLFARSGARLDVLHQEIPPDAHARSKQLASDAKRRFLAVFALQSVILKQVVEGLPFDEPLTEIGQQDGRLRPAWVYVYQQGLDTFRFQGDVYPVFDNEGRPLVPQVCSDFLLDTFERMSGTWWYPQDGARGRTAGRLDLEVDRADLRRTVGLVKFFERHPDWFQVRSVPRAEQIAMGHKKDFFEWVVQHAHDFEPGDIVLVRGKTPWDDKKEHTHSFFVLDTDPVTGVPLAVAGNAGRPSIWSLETEARRTPLRSIRHIVRPKLPWLEKVVDPDLLAPPSPPPLSVEKSNRPGW